MLAQSRSNTFNKKDGKLVEIKPFATIGIIGAGTMGAQIALHCAVHDYQVWLFSRSKLVAW
jgi:phosphoglycerate dehydrogenase-like enzyme